MTLLVFLVTPVQAQGLRDSLTVDLAEDHVDITTGFNGAHLSLFGVQDTPGQVAIVMTGPQGTAIVRQKQRFFGIWANGRGVKFENVPLYYDYALAAPEQDLASPDMLKEHGVGFGALRFDPEEEEGEHISDFQEALIRNKQAEGFYPEKPQDIVFLSDRFFKADFYIPANVPKGEYKIRTFLFHDGVVKDIKTTTVRVAQVGRSAAIFRFANDNAMIYGLLCVLFAMSAGWLSNIIGLRR